MYTNLNITPTPKSNILGDVNGDFEINSIDMELLVKYLLSMLDEKGLCISNADMNSDGQINAIDAVFFAAQRITKKIEITGNTLRQN